MVAAERLLRGGAHGDTGMLGPLLNRGATAEVYAWGDDQVLKLFNSNFPSDVVEYEASIVRLVLQAGVTAPAIFSTVRAQGRMGLVYERADGATLLHALVKRPWTVVRAALHFAITHASIHQHHQSQLPPRRELLRQKIVAASPLGPDLRDAAIRALEGLPDRTIICHGDYHPGNVLMSSRGPVVIDWIGAAQGHPLADVARASLLLRYATFPAYYGPQARRRFNGVRRWFHAIYLWCYGLQYPFTPAELDAWMLPVAAARLSEQVTQEEVDRLVKVVRRLAAGPGR